MNLDESSSFESGIIKNGNECPDAKKSPPNIKKLTPAPFNIIDTSHLYRLGVPSDVILFEAADDNIAAVAGFVLCQGKASVLRMDGAKLKCAAYGPEFGDAKEILPILVKNANKVLLAEALDSFSYGGLRDRKLFQMALVSIDDPKKQDEYRNAHEKFMRTSAIRFVYDAWQAAAKIRNEGSR